MNFGKIRFFIFGLVQKKFSLESPYVVKFQKILKILISNDQILGCATFVLTKFVSILYPFLLHKMRNLKIAIYVVKIRRKMKVKIQLDLFNEKVQEKGAGHFWTS